MRTRHYLFTLRLLAWLGLAGIALASLLPAEQMTRTGFDAGLEHLVAYAVVTGIWLAAYGARAPVFLIALLFALFAGGMELGQMVSPGRHPALIDALVGGAAAIFAETLYRLAAMSFAGIRDFP
jgi:VanZ family protein